MKKIYSLLPALLLFTISCKKDQFTTRPQLTFKSVSTTTLNPDQIINFSIEFTDKEGDIQDTMWIAKVTKNCGASDFAGYYPVPNAPLGKNAKGYIDVEFGYGINLGAPAITEPSCPNQNDTCVFRFVLKDKAGNVSDTAVSPQIVIIKR